jgi:hypothetical protein
VYEHDAERDGRERARISVCWEGLTHTRRSDRTEGVYSAIRETLAWFQNGSDGACCRVFLFLVRYAVCVSNLGLLGRVRVGRSAGWSCACEVGSIKPVIKAYRHLRPSSLPTAPRKDAMCSGVSGRQRATARPSPIATEHTLGRSLRPFLVQTMYEMWSPGREGILLRRC